MSVRLRRRGRSRAHSKSFARELALRLGPCGLVGLLLASGCGINPEQRYEKMRPLLQEAKYKDAQAFIESGKNDFYGQNNAVLYYLDNLMALHLAQKYSDSNAVIDKAAKKIDDLYTTSISNEAAAFLTNDNVKPYLGEDFERALIHVIGALNYSFLHERDEALVEARRVEQKLQVLNDAHRKERGPNDKSGPGEYSEDAFVRWFSGVLYESDGSEDSLNDAWIAYKKALEAYEKGYVPKYATAVPDVLIDDLVRVGTRLGFTDDVSAIVKRHPHNVASADSGAGNVVFLHLNGEAPYKVERHWEAVADTKLIKVAYPEFKTKPKRYAYAIFSIGGQSARTEKMEDVDAIAVANLNDHMGRIKAKMIARAIAKFVAAKATEAAGTKASGNEGVGKLFGALASVVGAATEKADLRSWLLLPASIDAARIRLAPGKYPVNVELHGFGGALIEKRLLGEVTVEPRRTSFVSLRAF